MLSSSRAPCLHFLLGVTALVNLYSGTDKGLDVYYILGGLGTLQSVVELWAMGAHNFELAIVGVVLMILFIIPHSIILNSFAAEPCLRCDEEEFLFTMGLLLHILVAIPGAILVMRLIRQKYR